MAMVLELAQKEGERFRVFKTAEKRKEDVAALFGKKHSVFSKSRNVK